VAVLTFAILLHLSLVLDDGKHLDENHQKLAIPAAFVKSGDKERTRQEGARCQRLGVLEDQVSRSYAANKLRLEFLAYAFSTPGRISTI